MPRRTSLKTLLSVDPRGLVAFRVALGALLAVDTLLRWPDLRAFYTDDGVLPVKPYVEQFANPLHYSLHLLSGGAAWQILLFALTLAAGLAVMLGYRTRLATVAGWVLLVSVQNRNPLLLNGGDVLLRLLYFWAMFLPLGGPLRRRVDEPYFSGGTVALVLQIAMVYLTTAAMKSGREWFPDGTASYYALSLDSLTSGFGVWLKQWWLVLRASTYVVYGLELLTAPLILCPFFYVPVRLGLIGALAIMHLNFAAAMRLGLFPWVDLAALIPLVPGPVWDRLLPAPHGDAADAGPPKERLAVTFATLFLIGLVALWNLQSLPEASIQVSQRFSDLTTALRLDQRWNMFAPFPLKEGGWFVMAGESVGGHRLDLIRGDGSAPDFAEPALASDLFPNARWRKYMMAIYDKSRTGYRLYFGKYVCRTWNGSHDGDDRLARFDLIFMRRLTVLPGEAAKVDRIVLWQHDCYPSARKT